MIACLAHAQDYALHEAVKPAEQVRWRHLVEVPGANGVFDRLQNCVLVDALGTPKHQRVIYLFAGPLHSMSEPLSNVLGVRAVYPLYVLEPRARSIWVALGHLWWLVHIESRASGAVDQSATGYKAIAHDHRLARRPRHRVNCAVLVEPIGRADRDIFPFHCSVFAFALNPLCRSRAVRVP